MIGILALRTKLRNAHNIEAQKLKVLNEKIFHNNIDVALDKIKLLQKSLETEE